MEILDLDVQILDLDVQIMDLDVQIQDLDVQILDLDIQIMDLDVQILDLDVQILDLDIQILDLESQTLDLDQNLGIEIQIHVSIFVWGRNLPGFWTSDLRDLPRQIWGAAKVACSLRLTDGMVPLRNQGLRASCTFGSCTVAPQPKFHLGFHQPPRP